MRILATVLNVDQLFERLELPYNYVDDAGVARTHPVLGWRCRTCQWTSLPGAVQGLPWPHECQRSCLMAAMDQKFGT